MKQKENDEFIICPLCIKENKGEIESRKRFISPLHILKHNYTVEQFKKEFPNQKLKIDSLCKQHSEKLKGAHCKEQVNRL